jgi:hypothetical protein
MFQFDILAFSHLGLLNGILLSGYCFFVIKILVPLFLNQSVLIRRAYFILRPADLFEVNWFLQKNF